MKNRSEILFASLLVAIAVAVAVKTFADIPQPVVSIAPYGTNQVAVVITNAVTNVTYDLYWTPALGNPNYPWTGAALGTVGQSNFIIGESTPDGFFKALLDTNNIPIWELADPNNPALGPLSITIDSPLNGSTFN
ncbi:MAG: hypothetical protein KGJ88_08355 [Verrucomicrobiota bacterium]|nr:hypothetical protein [Verrucomicrobiota bacterium]